MPQRVLDSAEAFEPAMHGLAPADGVWIGIAGLDIVRDGDGRWLVLEDNLRTPSGLGYWPTARAATLARLDPPPELRPRSIDGLSDALRQVIGPGKAVVLTDGEDNSAFWEHRWLAEHLGLPLAVPADLEVRDGAIHHLGEPLDAIYRRTNADEIDSDVGRLLYPAVASGALKLVNRFGTGVADDKLAHAYVEDMVRFYLGEEPALEQVETFDLGEPVEPRARARHLRRAGDQGPRLLRRDRRDDLPARGARRRRGAAREGPRGARRLHRAAAGRPLHAPDRVRRRARAAPRRPAAVRVHAPPRTTCGCCPAG